MAGVVIADGICPTQNCPSDKFMILAWIGHHEAIRLICKVCETVFIYVLRENTDP